MIITIDTREQTPWSFPAGVSAIRGTLATGDYSIQGLEHLAAIERKELGDLVGCCTHGRERFEAELHRLQSYRCRAVIVEASMGDVLAHRYRSQCAPAAVIASAAAWTQRYTVPFIWAGTADHAAGFALAMFNAPWRDLERLAAVMKGTAHFSTTTATPGQEPHA